MTTADDHAFGQYHYVPAGEILEFYLTGSRINVSRRHCVMNVCSCPVLKSARDSWAPPMNLPLTNTCGTCGKIALRLVSSFDFRHQLLLSSELAFFQLLLYGYTEWNLNDADLKNQHHIEITQAIHNLSFTYTCALIIVTYSSTASFVHHVLGLDKWVLL